MRCVSLRCVAWTPTTHHYHTSRQSTAQQRRRQQQPHRRTPAAQPRRVAPQREPRQGQLLRGRDQLRPPQAPAGIRRPPVPSGELPREGNTTYYHNADLSFLLFSILFGVAVLRSSRRRRRSRSKSSSRIVVLFIIVIIFRSGLSITSIIIYCCTL